MEKLQLQQEIDKTKDALIMELSRQACNIPNSPEERLLRKKLSSLKAQLKELPEVPSDEDIEKRFPIPNPEMITVINLSTRNHWIREGIKWLQKNIDNNPEVSSDEPKIICICGSGRFLKEMHEVEERLTLEGKIVLMIGVNTKDVARTMDLSQYKPMLDELHLRKIDLADEVFIVNKGGYIGESTKKEIEYAIKTNKLIEYFEQKDIDKAGEEKCEHPSDALIRDGDKDFCLACNNQVDRAGCRDTEHAITGNSL
jgi:hypothetical protein